MTASNSVEVESFRANDKRIVAVLCELNLLSVSERLFFHILEKYFRTFSPWNILQLGIVKVEQSLGHLSCLKAESVASVHPLFTCVRFCESITDFTISNYGLVLFLLCDFFRAPLSPFVLNSFRQEVVSRQYTILSIPRTGDSMVTSPESSHLFT